MLECVYASNTVGHMLIRKAISRDLRGHILVSGALNVMHTSEIFGIPLPGTQQVIGQEEDATTAPDHQFNQSDPPEPEENPGTRPTDNTSQTPDILTAAGKLYDDLIAGDFAGLTHSRRNSSTTCSGLRCYARQAQCQVVAAVS